MAIGILVEIPGGTQANYDAVIARMDLQNNPPEGCLVHMAGPTEGGWRVVDVWESQDHFDRFVSERLAAALQAENTPESSMTPFPLHFLFAQGTEG
ncbi:MAG: hypothetical protein QOK40_3652 [Miltoncostaeaceae bacterium]|jgi:hypothetical protein|nr:hypothetical protein [Miltoncostaeaceae bacterium]